MCTHAVTSVHMCSGNHVTSSAILFWAHCWDEKSHRKGGRGGRVTDTNRKGHNDEMKKCGGGCGV